MHSKSWIYGLSKDKIWYIKIGSSTEERLSMNTKIKCESDIYLGKALKKDNLSDFQAVIQNALDLLDKKNLSLIIHGVSFPSLQCEDTGIGSPNTTGGRKFIDFIKVMGFNSIQLGPEGKTSAANSSPYAGTIFSNNTLFIDLAQLTEPLWAEILNLKTLETIVKNNPNKGNNQVAYDYIYQEQTKALREAFDNFKVKLNNNESSQVKAIGKKFADFKEKNKSWLEKDAIYETLLKQYNCWDWPGWNNQLDKNLFSPKNEAEAKVANDRLIQIQAEYKDEIEFYEFCQFISTEQKEQTKKYTLDHGVKMIADCQVGLSDRDNWANKSLLLEDLRLGAPPDYFSKEGQAWDFSVLDPEKIFNEDGSLGDAGKLLKARFDKIFEENPGGVRIDHIIGLIDPWVYPANKSPKSGGRLYSSPENPRLKQYSRIGIEDLNPESAPDDEDRVAKLTDKQIEKYAEIIEKIVIPSAKDKGIPKESIVCEDLGTLTFPVVEVLKKLDLSGVRVTQFVDPKVETHMYRGRNVTAKHWIVAGTHDNEPLAVWADSLYKKSDIKVHVNNLVEDLIPQDNDELRETFKKKLLENPNEFVKAKLAELFASPSRNIQIFFSDFFGIREQYNKPGTPSSQNWSLRVPNNYKEFYSKQIVKNEGLNLPEVLKMAIESKGKDFATKNQQLIEELEKYAEILRTNS